VDGQDPPQRHSSEETGQWESMQDFLGHKMNMNRKIQVTSYIPGSKL
jgi:hypothetical protein